MRILVLLFVLLFPSWAFAQGAAVNLNCNNSNSPPNNWQQCPGNKSTTNHSNTITTGLTYQTLLAASSGRSSLTIENNNTSDACELIIGTNQVTSGTTTTSSTVTVSGNSITALQASITLIAAGSYTRYWPYVPSDTIYGTCATTGDSIYVDTQ